MRMLIWMNIETLRDRIRNECVHMKLEIALDKDKIRENRLR